MSGPPACHAAGLPWGNTGEGATSYTATRRHRWRAKVRIYATAPNAARVYQISVLGTREQINDESARLFFNSCKHQGMVRDDLKKKAQDAPTK